MAEALIRQPVYTEIAGTSFGDVIQPYIGELAYDPRQPSRYRSGDSDISAELLLYRDVLRDERAYSALAQRLDAAVAVSWEVQPGGPLRRDRLAAEDLAAQLREFRFERTCRQLLFVVWYGYGVAEALWSPDGRRVRLADLVVRAPDRFRWANDGRLLLRLQTHPRGEPVPAAKFVALTQPGEHGDVPHAPGLARWCFWPVYLKRNAIKFWGVALDKFAIPTPVGRHRANPGKGEVSKLLKVVSNIASGAGVALPEGQSIELLQSAARTGGDFESFVKYFDNAITTLLLGQSSTTDQGPWRGTAEIQKDVRDEIIASDCRLLDAALNTTVARWLTAWNFPGAAPPRIVHDASPPEDLDKRASREETVGRTSGLRPTQAHVEEVYGGRWEPAPASPMQGPEPAPATDVQPRRGGRAGPMLAAGDGEDPIGQAVHALLAGDGWAPLMEPMVEPLKDAIDAAIARGESLKMFKARVPELMRRMDETATAETLHNMTFSGVISGQGGEQ